MEMDLAVERGGEARAMGDHQEAAAGSRDQIARERENVIRRRLVEIAGRLVGEQKQRFCRQRAADRDPLLLAAGQLVGIALEQTAKPECYGACAEAWPPVLTKGSPTAASGTKQELLGTTKRTDGTTQVTYGGHPLYFYAHEAKNEVKCHNIQGFGGLWLVVTPAGRAAAP